MSILNESLEFDGKLIPNRVVFQPMEGCDCLENGEPGELTMAKYMNAARSGAGLIWMEANAVCPEGRTNPGQMMLTRENLGVFREFVALMRKTAMEECGINPVIILQLTHSGRQSIVPMIAYRHPIYEKTRPVTDDNIVSDEYLDTLPEKYVRSALLAYEAGFDGVDVKSCHGYLFQELLSAFTRTGRYGGSFENRTRLYLDCVYAVKAAVPEGFLVVTRLGIADMVPHPYGFGTNEDNELDLYESDMLISELIAAGIRMINVTIGNPYYNPHINRPFRKGGYEPPEAPEVGLARFITVQSHIKEKFPEITLVGSGLSYYRQDLMDKAEQMIESGAADLVGFGRASIAYPMLYRDWLDGKFDVKKTCVACSKCTALMRHKCVSGCAVFNEYYRNLYKEKVECKK
ncbi:MAG: flavin oxidoreductase/NADH oxidase [Ruminococcaceae bacterium]|nr:flavin oxidoreductase/NADH oxidase [Oscillospiraceae bacterium]